MRSCSRCGNFFRVLLREDKLPRSSLAYRWTRLVEIQRLREGVFTDWDRLAVAGDRALRKITTSPGFDRGTKDERVVS
jgi:hypothetical protein